MTVSAAFGGAVAGGVVKPTPIVETPGVFGNDVRGVLKVCEDLIAESQRAETHHVSDTDDGHVDDSENREIKGHAVKVNAGSVGSESPNLRATVDHAGGTDSATVAAGFGAGRSVNDIAGGTEQVTALAATATGVGTAYDAEAEAEISEARGMDRDRF